MRKMLAIATLLAVVACNSSAPKPEATVPENATSAAAFEYSIKARYSSDWEIGDPALAQKVIDLWRYYDNNTLDSARAFFADSVYMDMPGFTGKLHSDTALHHAKADRARFSSLVSEIDVILPVNAKNHPEEKIVTIWGQETGVLDGKGIKRRLHETWAFNNEGKVIWMIRYDGNTEQ
ncbi:MAG TPA: hypothetical protein VLA58_01120 [Chitinophagaceae bacterium]|nr:hypothetical protein [Chitinophagaceae bacterium]